MSILIAIDILYLLDDTHGVGIAYSDASALYFCTSVLCLLGNDVVAVAPCSTKASRSTNLSSIVIYELTVTCEIIGSRISVTEPVFINYKYALCIVYCCRQILDITIIFVRRT